MDSVKTLIISQRDKELERLKTELAGEGYTFFVAPEIEEAMSFLNQNPKLVIIEIIDLPAIELEQILSLTENKGVPVIALLPESSLKDYQLILNLDDFIIKPYRGEELRTRIKRLLGRTGETAVKEIIQCGDLVIDINSYEVSLAREKVDLTYKEYQLLKFLLTNKGRVLNHQVLLNKVWGMTTIAAIGQWMSISEGCVVRLKTALIVLSKLSEV